VRALILMLLLLLAGAAEAATTDKACAWIVEPTADRENILFPEITTRYLAAIIPAPPGGYVEVSGDFPHARYMSLQTYSTRLQSLSNLHDVEIVPDAGSSNPFLPGADRTVAQRHYTVRVVDEAPPAGPRPPNTLYYRGEGATDNGRVLVYRIYVPDSGTQPFGAVPAPDLALVLPGGVRVPVPVCPDLVPDTSFLTEILAHAGLSDYPAPPIGLFARADPEWHKYVNAPTGYTDGLTSNEVLGPLNPALRALALKLPAGLGENADNKYVYTALSREFGDVALLRARLPTTPRTFDGEARMGTGQLRFWSMCSGNRATFTYDCLVDKDVPLDAGSNFMIAVSTASDRPANARPECGVGWLPWGPEVQLTLIMRNMLPDPSFTQSVQAADQGTERATLGPYYPLVTYFPTAADFEAAIDCTAPAYLPVDAPVAASAPAATTSGGGSLDAFALALLLLPAGARRRARHR
jgi:hypothetical protein